MQISRLKLTVGTCIKKETKEIQNKNCKIACTFVPLVTVRFSKYE